MAEVEQYRKLVCDFLLAQCPPDEDHGEVESQLILDSERDRYLLIDMGWQDLKRIYACVIHLEIREGKIWIQRNMTETDIATALVESGIPKEDIILGLQPAYKRPYTGYGAA
ncbi:MAG: XisI protein [Cyanobacteria bacterium P01_G01_bin.54]